MISAFWLRSQGRQPPLPLSLSLAEGELKVEQWLRVLPRKRLVGRGLLNGQPVLVKLFIAKAAARHWHRESQGLAALQQAQLATPAVRAQGQLDGGLYYLATDFLAQAQTLDQRWHALPEHTPGQPEAMAVLQLALRSLAQLHRQGLIQHDLHLGNFLQQGEQLYLIDGDAISAVCPGQPLPAAQIEDNLALFFAQLAPAWDALSELLLIDYLQVNSACAINPDRLQQQIGKARQRRLQDWLGKALRDCSAFAVQRSWWRFSSVARQEQSALAPLLANLDSAFDGTPSLKDGASSSVTRLQHSGRSLVIKRYNIKGFGHWLRRCLRPSRASHSWLAAQHLRFLGIATPEPLAMVESRFGPLRWRAWLVTEYLPGRALSALIPTDGSELPDAQQQRMLLDLFAQLRINRIAHGDCKGSNILWADGRFWLIDLDAMQAFAPGARWQKTWAKDRARLIRNWPSGSAMACWLQQALPDLPD